MNGYFKGFMPNETENSSENASGTKEPPKMRMRTIPDDEKIIPKNDRQVSEKHADEVFRESKTREDGENNNSEVIVNSGITDIENFNNSLGRGIGSINNITISDDYANPEFSERDFPERDFPEREFSEREFSERELLEDGQKISATAPYSGRGSIVVQAFTASRAMPLENVKISIISGENAPIDVNEILFTGEDGKTAEVFLPTPDSSFSTHSQTAVPPYAVYSIKPELNGYHTESDSIKAVVFDKVKSIQNIDMIPDTESGV